MPMWRNSVDSNRFDALTRAIALRPSRRQLLGWLVAALAGGRLGHALAQERTATAGNGGRAGASADGGAVRVGEINSGGNTGNAIAVGDTIGDVEIHGGTVANTTRIDVAADGGAAIADASGGDGNVAGVLRPGPESGDSDDDDDDPTDSDDDDLEEDDLETDDSEAVEPYEPEIDLPDPTPTPLPTPSPTPPPTPEPTPDPTPSPTPETTPSPTPPSPTPSPTPTPPCPCSGSNPYYCRGTPSGCCHTDRCGINRQSGAYCCNCGTGQCECFPPICVGS
jgi:hypothetical protein